jgi:hypothetical protein
MEKTNVLEIAKEHFSKKSVRTIKVDEWKDADGKPLEFTATPLTLYEKRSLFKGAKSDDVSVLADVIILKLRDKNENKVFKTSDKDDLMHKVDPDIIADIANSIMATEGVNVHDYEKK